MLDEVSSRLEQLWSPQEIAQRMRLDFPEDPQMRASQENMHQSLFVQGRVQLCHELACCLRAARRGPSWVTGVAAVADLW